MIPEVGKEYYCYDDGKVTDTRQYKVLVVAVTPWEKVSPDDQQYVEDIQSDSFFKSKTDYVIYGVSFERPEKPEIELFIRNRYEEWFGTGDYWCNGILDADGSLTKQLKEAAL